MIGAVIGILCLSTALKGQSKDEEINLSISKEENGELRTFEKTYRSMEEMKNDKELRTINYNVPGDPSSAAFFISAACLKPGSKLIVKNLLFYGYIKTTFNPFSTLFP